MRPGKSPQMATFRPAAVSAARAAAMAAGRVCGWRTSSTSAVGGADPNPKQTKPTLFAGVLAQAFLPQFNGDEWAGIQWPGGGEGAAGMLADEHARGALRIGV